MIKAGAPEKTVLSAAHLNFTGFANASKTAVMAGKTTLKKGVKHERYLRSCADYRRRTSWR
jgi:hypothetical protein